MFRTVIGKLMVDHVVPFVLNSTTDAFCRMYTKLPPATLTVVDIILYVEIL